MQPTPFTFIPNWLTKADIDMLWPILLKLPWQKEHLTLYGKTHPMPRKVIWIADHGVKYRYANKDHYPEPWPPTLSQIRLKLEQTLGHDFNGVLGNLYQDGNDYMGWHSDDEKSIDDQSPIVSLSLGATRKFKFRAKNNHSNQSSIALTNGSLLVMPAGSQKYWQHTLPKMLKVTEPRINLTFRVMHSCVHNR